MTKKATIDAAVQAVTKEWMDKGKIIEAGWAAMRIVVIPADASATQLHEMRKAYFAGAQHLFASIVGGLEEDAEPTATDLRRMDMIDAELQKFAEELKLDLATTGGRQ